MSAAIPLLVLLPLAGATLCLVLRGRPLLLAVGVTVVATAGASIVLVADVVTHGVQSHALGGWGAPLGIELRADGLSALLLAMTALICGLGSYYATGYLRGYGEEAETDAGQPATRRWSTANAFWPLWLFMWAALNALFVSRDAFNIYVALELVTLSGIALLVLERGREALAAGMRYLLAAFLGSLAYLLGVGLLYAAFHVLDLAALAGQVQPTPAALVALALMTVGLALKTALFPLHFWLPRAHATAPTPVSAALSALVVKGSFYVLLRLWFEVFGGAVPIEGAHVLGALGALAIGWGSLQALRARRLKMAIAHSTVAQVGYLFLVMPLAGVAATQAGPAAAQAAADAWNGGAYHVVSHAVAKAAMFLAAGAVMATLGHDRIEGMTGLAARLPLTMFAFGAAGASLIGLPPMGGFVAKLLLLNSAIGSGQWWYAVVIVAGGVLTAGYVFLIVGRTFTLPAEPVRVTASETTEPSTRPIEASRQMQLVPFVLVLVALALGLAAAPPLELLEIGLPVAGAVGGGLAR